MPGNDHPARAVGNEGREKLIVCHGTEGDAGGGPEGAARAVHALSVDVVVGASAVVIPANDGPAPTVGDDRGIKLLVRGGTDGDAVGRPQGAPGGVHPLGVEVVAGAAAVIVPGNDGPTRTVGDDRGRTLIVHGARDGGAVGRPKGAAGGVHPLGIDIVAGAATVIVPGNDGPTRTVGDDSGKRLDAGGGRDGDAVLDPISDDHRGIEAKDQQRDNERAETVHDDIQNAGPVRRGAR